MLKLYTWSTPNGYKVPILLEELGLEYELHTINISKDEQKTSEYLAMNPNGKIPVLVDEDAEGGSLTIFESGAILEYLAEKEGKFLPKDVHGKYAVMEWLMFQMGGIGPMFGQAAHFIKFAPEKIEYGITRYTNEVKRLLGVLDTRLADVEYLGGEYSIADMATWPWVRAAAGLEGMTVSDYKNVEKWFKRIQNSAAVDAALKKVDEAVEASKVSTA